MNFTDQEYDLIKEIAAIWMTQKTLNITKSVFSVVNAAKSTFFTSKFNLKQPKYDSKDTLECYDPLFCKQITADRAKQFIISKNGIENIVHVDPTSKKLIVGIGHQLNPENEPYFMIGDDLTVDQIIDLFDYDFKSAMDACIQKYAENWLYFPEELKIALIDQTFHTGDSSLSKVFENQGPTTEKSTKTSVLKESKIPIIPKKTEILSNFVSNLIKNNKFSFKKPKLQEKQPISPQVSTNLEQKKKFSQSDDEIFKIYIAVHSKFKNFEQTDEYKSIMEGISELNENSPIKIKIGDEDTINDVIQKILEVHPVLYGERFHLKVKKLLKMSLNLDVNSQQSLKSVLATTLFEDTIHGAYFSFIISSSITALFKVSDYFRGYQSEFEFKTTLQDSAISGAISAAYSAGTIVFQRKLMQSGVSEVWSSRLSAPLVSFVITAIPGVKSGIENRDFARISKSISGSLIANATSMGLFSLGLQVAAKCVHNVSWPIYLGVGISSSFLGGLAYGKTIGKFFSGTTNKEIFIEKSKLQKSRENWQISHVSKSTPDLEDTIFSNPENIAKISKRIQNGESFDTIKQSLSVQNQNQSNSDWRVATKQDILNILRYKVPQILIIEWLVTLAYRESSDLTTGLLVLKEKYLLQLKQLKRKM